MQPSLDQVHVQTKFYEPLHWCGASRRAELPKAQAEELRAALKKLEAPGICAWCVALKSPGSEGHSGFAPPAGACCVAQFALWDEAGRLLFDTRTSGPKALRCDWAPRPEEARPWPLLLAGAAASLPGKLTGRMHLAMAGAAVACLAPRAPSSTRRGVLVECRGPWFCCVSRAMRFFVRTESLLCAILAKTAANWVYQLGTDNWDSVQALALSSDNIFVAGETEGSLENARFGDSDIFVTKLNATGDPMWIRQRGSIGADRVRDIRVTASGDVVLVGFTEESLDGFPWAGGHDIYVMTFNSDGAWQWTTQRGTFYEDHATVVQQTDSGDIVVAGDTRGSLDGNTNAGYSDIFLMKPVSLYLGEWLWTRQRGSSSVDVVAAMQLSGDSFVVAGHTDGDLDGHTNAGSDDMFVMKLSSNGTWLWTHQRGSTYQDDHATALLLFSGRIYVAGNTRGSLDGNVNQGSADIFLMEFDVDGVWQWTLQRGSAADDFATGAQLFQDGLVVTGFTQGALDGNSNRGEEDVFLMEFDGNVSWTGTWQWGTAGQDFLNRSAASTCAVAVTSSSEILLAGRTSESMTGFRRQGVFDAFVVAMSVRNVSLMEPVASAPPELQASCRLLLLSLLFLWVEVLALLNQSCIACGAPAAFRCRRCSAGYCGPVCQRGTLSDELAFSLDPL
eukprot:s370_g6.t1